MLESLIESRRHAADSGALGGGAVSAAVHSALIAGAVYATLHASEVVRTDRLVIDVHLPLAQQPQPEPTEETPHIARPRLGPLALPSPAVIPAQIPPPSAVPFDPGRFTGLEVGPAGLWGRDTTPGHGLGLPAVYASEVVEERPERTGGPLPRYPEILRQAGIGGLVTVECIVDTAGRAEPRSVRVVSSTNPLFDQPARDAIAASTFRPGRLAGRAVRVRVQVPLTFQVSRGNP